MASLFLVAFVFLAGLGFIVRRSAASGRAPQVVLEVLPLALLFVPVQLLQDIWHLLATFKALAKGTGGVRTVLSVCVDHHKAWAFASWLVVAAMLLAAVSQAFAVRRGASPALSRAAAPADAPDWVDWILPLSTLMVLPVCFLALFVQRVESRILAFVGTRFGVGHPPLLVGWVADGDAGALGGVIGTEAVLAMIGAVMVICTLLAFAALNAFITRARRPSRSILVLGWAALGITCGLAVVNALRLDAVTDWAEQVLPLLPAL